MIEYYRAVADAMLANQATIEFHITLSTVDALECASPECRSRR
ncbi:hypothetical protein EV193_104179 [Herbihabitans rhizosphaerae]|uniref:Uncharacterized protein n=1 Tax=Herbihabitans rhizosphaerae TaxID=1872711 RepID=A0A4Q7KQ77_9PSEU|nr:hypothetical protein [Herbihabitans rhizosphaerae]RZS38968.1 hypothetical protein EV193_104179 [Herbihabitans rhizosphaerae]